MLNEHLPIHRLADGTITDAETLKVASEVLALQSKVTPKPHDDIFLALANRLLAVKPLDPTEKIPADVYLRRRIA